MKNNSGPKHANHPSKQGERYLGRDFKSNAYRRGSKDVKRASWKKERQKEKEECHEQEKDSEAD